MHHYITLLSGLALLAAVAAALSQSGDRQLTLLQVLVFNEKALGEGAETDIYCKPSDDH